MYSSGYHSHFQTHLHNNHHTNSYYHNYANTNSNNYYNSYNKYYNDTAVGYEKYFPKQLIHILPGTSNLPSTQEEKLIHPLNTYSYDTSPNSHTLNSPFYRGQIYHSGIHRDKYSTQYSTVSTESNIQPLTHCKKDNPFYKKYLLSEKNRQLENYALYSSVSSPEYQNSLYDYKNNHKSQRNSKKFQQRSKQYLDNAEEMGEGMLRLAKKYGNSKTQSSNQQIDMRQQKPYFDSQDYEKISKNYTNQKNQNKYREYSNLVESDVDEKQFDSFGKGKKKNSNENQEQNEYQDNHGESIILGLNKVIHDTKKRSQEIIKTPTDDYVPNKIKKNDHFSREEEEGRSSRRKPVFIESDDQSHRSGTFRIPDAIIDEINNPKSSTRSPYNIRQTQKLKKNQHLGINSQKVRYSNNNYKKQGKTDYAQTNQIPDRIYRRGKMYQKISI